MSLKNNHINKKKKLSTIRNDHHRIINGVLEICYKKHGSLEYLRSN